MNMTMTYDGTMVMPKNFAVVTEDEMTYVDGGWNIRFDPTKRFGIYSGVNVTLTASVADCAWIIAAGAAFTAVLGSLGVAIPVIGPIIAIKSVIIGAAFVSFAATIVATNDKACKKTFTVTHHIGF